MKWPWKRWPWEQRQVDVESCQDAKCEEFDRIKEQEERERRINRRVEALERYAQALKEQEDGSR